MTPKEILVSVGAVRVPLRTWNAWVSDPSGVSAQIGILKSIHQRLSDAQQRNAIQRERVRKLTDNSMTSKAHSVDIVRAGMADPIICGSMASKLDASTIKKRPLAAREEFLRPSIEKQGEEQR